MRRALPNGVAVAGVILLVIVTFAVAAAMHHRRNGMGPTSCQFSAIGLALKQYAADYDNRYPWIAGSSQPPWTFLGMLVPDYTCLARNFIYEGSPDRKFADLDWKEKQPLAPFRDTDLISFSYGIDGSDPANPTSWTDDAPATVRLLADKKAAIPLPQGREGRRISHWGNGRKFLYNDGHWKWERNKAAVDPDPDHDDVGAPGAVEYRAWWSDPLYWFEWRNRHGQEG